MRLFASASRSPLTTVISASNPIAVRTKTAAGRACNATSDGNLSWVSELLRSTGFLRSSGHLIERLPG
jgi:hypothetical protein